GTGLGVWDTILRKLAHTAEYAVLGALLVRAVHRSRVAFVLGVLYAASDELHQTFVPGRHGSPVDVAIDSVGIAVGIVVWQRAARAGQLVCRPSLPSQSLSTPCCVTQAPSGSTGWRPPGRSSGSTRKRWRPTPRTR